MDKVYYIFSNGKKNSETALVSSEQISTINLLNEILLSRDFVVLSEKSKTRTVVSVLDNSIDVLFLELNLRNATNFDIIEIIRKTRPRLPIIVITQDNSFDSLLKLKRAGVLYCILKPIQIEELTDVIEAVKEKGVFC